MCVKIELCANTALQLAFVKPASRSTSRCDDVCSSGY